MKDHYHPIRNKIKMTVKDLTAFLDEDTKVLIRDGTGRRIKCFQIIYSTA